MVLIAVCGQKVGDFRHGSGTWGNTSPSKVGDLGNVSPSKVGDFVQLSLPRCEIKSPTFLTKVGT